MTSKATRSGQAPSTNVTHRALTLDDLEQVSGGFELDAEHWNDRYGDWIRENYQDGSGAPLDPRTVEPDYVFPSYTDENGYEQGGLGIG